MLFRSELTKLNNAVSTQLLTDSNGDDLLELVSSLPINAYNDSEVMVTLTLPTQLMATDVVVLAPISSEVLDSLLLLVGNDKKAEQFAAYMKTPIKDDKTKENIEACMGSMINLIDSFSWITDLNPNSELEEINELDLLFEALKEPFETFKAAPTKGDALALQIVITSISNIFAQISAGYAVIANATGDVVTDIKSDPTTIKDWTKDKIVELFELKQFIGGFVDTLAHELAVMDAILPNCGSSVNFDLFKIIESVLNAE